MNCLSDRFTKRQLSDPRSQLSKTGLELCSELEKVLNKPVYYYLFQPRGLTIRPSVTSLLCPNCGGEWKESKRCETVDLICERCRLAIDKDYF